MPDEAPSGAAASMKDTGNPRWDLDLAAIFEMERYLGTAEGFAAIAEATLLSVLGTAGATGAALFVPEGKSLVCRATKGQVLDGLEEVRLPLSLVLERAEPFDPGAALPGFPLAFPLRIGSRPVGLLVVGLAIESAPFDEAKRHVVQILSAMAAAAIANSWERDISRAMFSANLSGLLVVGNDGRIRKSNPPARAIFGDSLEGKSYADLFRFDDEDPVRACLDGGRPVDRKTIIGLEWTWNLSVTPLLVAGRFAGAVIGFLRLGRVS